MPVIGMIEAKNHLRSRHCEGRDLRRREGEMHELHGRGLPFRRGAILIRLGRRANLLAAQPDECRLLDAAERAENAVPSIRIVDPARAQTLYALGSLATPARTFEVGRLRYLEPAFWRAL